MLDNLKGIQSARVTLPEEKPRWLELVVDIERTADVHALETSSYTKDGEVRDISCAISEIPGLTLKDLDLYMRLTGYLDKILGRTEDTDCYRCYIATKMLESICKSAESPVYLGGTGIDVHHLFESLNLEKDLIIDNFTSSAILERTFPNEHCLVVANSRGEYMLDFPRNQDGNVIILANSHCGRLMTDSYHKDGRCLILANSEYGELDEKVVYGYRYRVVVNCKETDSDYPHRVRQCDCICQHDNVNFPAHISSQVKSLCKQMQGKNGLEIYALGKQVVSILEEADK